MALTQARPPRRFLVLAIQTVFVITIIKVIFDWRRTSSGAATFRPHGLGNGGNLATGHEASVVLSEANLTAYVKSVMDPTATHIPRMECPQPSLRRYEHLKAFQSPLATASKIKYFFALDIRDEGIELMPRLLGSIVETVQFLGPQSCAVSIVAGGGTPDGSYDVVRAVKVEVEKLGAKFYLSHPNIVSAEGDRFANLAKLRNLALEPLTNSTGGAVFSPETDVIFLNDVAACMEDILELVHQKIVQQADMTCAMDWAHIPDATFYDIYISRTISGNTFFHLDNTGSWEHSKDLFHSEEDVTTRHRFEAHRPFQVYACWNGGVVFSAAPLFRTGVREGIEEADKMTADPRYKVDPVRFRISMEGECFMGEPTLFCKDLWYRGFGRIAVVPTVNFQYTDADGRRIKKDKGYVSQWVGPGQELGEEGEPERIDWQRDPPEKIICARTWQTQHWLPWNESLAPPPQTG